LTNATATGPWTEYRGGVGFFIAYGTWNGASVALNYKADNDGTISLQALNSSGQSATLSANGMQLVALPPGLYQAVVTGSPTGLNAYITPGIREVR
jgi:hypothetical protein